MVKSEGVPVLRVNMVNRLTSKGGHSDLKIFATLPNEGYLQSPNSRLKG